MLHGFLKLTIVVGVLWDGSLQKEMSKNLQLKLSVI